MSTPYQIILEKRTIIESKFDGLKLEIRNKTPDSIFIFYNSRAIAQIYRTTGIITNPEINTELFQDSKEEIETIINQLQEYYK